MLYYSQKIKQKITSTACSIRKNVKEILERSFFYHQERKIKARGS